MRTYPRHITTTYSSMAPTHVRPDDLGTCVSCGLCHNDGPTYRVLGDEADSPRGRIQLIRDLVADVGAPSETTRDHLEAWLGGRACETACPSGVPFGRIMEGARDVLREREQSNFAGSLGRAALDTVAHPRRLSLFSRMTDLSRRLGLIRVARALGGRLAWAASLAPAREGPSFAGTERSGASVDLFAGCIMREAFGETERATVRLLERQGETVSTPEEQTCCGALHAHAGEGPRARELARYNIDAFAGSDAKIVVNAAGCGAHLKAYGELLAADPARAERAQAFAGRVRDASEFARPRAQRARRPLRVVYQDACPLAPGQRLHAHTRA